MSRTRVHVTADGAQSAQREARDEALGVDSTADGLKRLFQDRLDADASTGVWVRVGPGKWEPQRRAAAGAAAVSATLSFEPTSTQVVAFSASPAKSSNSSSGGARKVKSTSELLRSDARWSAFLATLNSEFGHNSDASLEQPQQQLAVEDLE